MWCCQPSSSCLEVTSSSTRWTARDGASERVRRFRGSVHEQQHQRANAEPIGTSVCFWAGSRCSERSNPAQNDERAIAGSRASIAPRRWPPLRWSLAARPFVAGSWHGEAVSVKRGGSAAPCWQRRTQTHTSDAGGTVVLSRGGCRFASGTEGVKAEPRSARCLRQPCAPSPAFGSPARASGSRLTRDRAPARPDGHERSELGLDALTAPTPSPAIIEMGVGSADVLGSAPGLVTTVPRNRGSSHGAFSWRNSVRNDEFRHKLGQPSGRPARADARLVSEDVG